MSSRSGTSRAAVLGCCCCLCVLSIGSAVAVLYFATETFEDFTGEEIPKISIGSDDESPISPVPTSAPVTGGITNVPNPTANPPTLIPTKMPNPACVEQRCCNGLVELCDQPVNDILFATMHNGMATEEDDFSGALNHNLGLEKAVEAGFRGMNLDLCSCSGELVFCHGLCFFGSKPIAPTLQFFVDFLDSKPDEVFLFTIQMNSDAGDDVDLDSFESLLTATPGFTDYMYVHPADGSVAWPTMNWLIDNNKRMIFFHFNGPNNCDPNVCPAGLHYYFDYAGETDFQFSTIADVSDTSQACQITRGNAQKDFFGVNIFLQLSGENNAPTLNDYDFVTNQLETCSELNGGIDVNLVYVDYWSIGDVLAATRDYNLNRFARRQ